MAITRREELESKAKALCIDQSDDVLNARSMFLVELQTSGLSPEEMLACLSAEVNGARVANFFASAARKNVFVVHSLAVLLRYLAPNVQGANMLALLRSQNAQSESLGSYMATMSIAPIALVGLQLLHFLADDLPPANVMEVLMQTRASLYADLHVYRNADGKEVIKSWFALLTKLLDRGLPARAMVTFLQRPILADGNYILGSNLMLEPSAGYDIHDEMRYIPTADPVTMYEYVLLLNKLNEQLSLTELFPLLREPLRDLRRCQGTAYLRAVKQVFVDVLCGRQESGMDRNQRIKNILRAVYGPNTSILGMFFYQPATVSPVTPDSEKELILRNYLTEILQPADTAFLLQCCYELAIQAVDVPEEITHFLDARSLCQQVIAAATARNLDKASLGIQLLLTSARLTIPDDYQEPILDVLIRLKSHPSVGSWEKIKYFKQSGHLKDQVEALITLTGNEAPTLKLARMRASIEACSLEDSFLYQVIHLSRKIGKSKSRAKNIESAMNKAISGNPALESGKAHYIRHRRSLIDAVPASALPASALPASSAASASPSSYSGSFFHSSAAAAAASRSPANQGRTLLAETTPVTSGVALTGALSGLLLI